MCNAINLFHDIRDVEGSHHITIPDSSHLTVKKIGRVHLATGLVLQNVLFVPELCFNLISVSKLSIDNNVSIIFATNNCYLQGHSMNKLLPLGKLHHGLCYTLDRALLLAHDAPIFLHKDRFATVATKDTINHVKLLHLRFGHLPFSRIKVMYPLLNVKAVQDAFLCSVCPSARQTRTSFPHSHVTATSPFELLHVDIWGPYAHKTYSGCSSFLTVVDDCSRNTWLYLLKSKAHSVIILHQLLAHIETQHNARVKIIRTDNVKELCEGDMLQLYLSKGIYHQNMAWSSENIAIYLRPPGLSHFNLICPLFFGAMSCNVPRI